MLKSTAKHCFLLRIDLEIISILPPKAGNRNYLRQYRGYNYARYLKFERSHNFVPLRAKDARLLFANLALMWLMYWLIMLNLLYAVTQYTDINGNNVLRNFEVELKTLTIFNQPLFSYEINPKPVLFLGYLHNHLELNTLNLSLTNSPFY